MKEDPNSPALAVGVDYRGTPNATKRVTMYRKPGRKRAAPTRYVKINLPRLTRAVFVLVLLAGAVGAAVTAMNGREVLPSSALLWSFAGLAGLLAVIAAATKIRFWTPGLVVPVYGLVLYLIGSFTGDAPFIWNGGTEIQAVLWNLVLITSLVYLVLYALIRYETIAVYPDDQNFLD